MEVKAEIDTHKDVESNLWRKTVEEKERLAQQLADKSDNFKKHTNNVRNEIQKYIDNPNNVLQGYYEVQSIEDLVYNENTGGYEHSKSLASDGKGSTYLQFAKNKIVFKRPDGTPKINALKFDKLENEYYKFEDGFGQSILITKDNVFLNYYHTPNSKGVFTKKTSYLVTSGFNFLK